MISACPKIASLPGCIIFAYLIGSIPFAWLFTYFVTGRDIRTLGTGNPGAANVARAVGRKWGIVVWAADTVKTILPMSLARAAGIENVFLLAVVGLAAVAGHCYPVFLKFKGGRGASGAGAIYLFLAPKLFPVVVALWFYAQKTNPRSLKIFVQCLVIFFLFLFLLYPAQARELAPATVIIILFCLIANKEVLRKVTT